MKKVKAGYSVVDDNRLVIRRGRTEVVPRGRFVLDAHNRLSYLVEEPRVWKRQYHVPSRIDLEGTWELDEDHNFVLILREAKARGVRTGLALKGDIISAEGNRIALELKSRDLSGNTHMQVLQFSGNWQTDEQNRLVFALKKAGSPDILTFTGAWEINRNQQIEYIFEKKDGRSKTASLHTLLLEGFWQISEGSRLRYIVSRGIGSFFDFRVQAESPTLRPRSNQIKYRLGMGMRGKKPLYEKTITLYGVWKFSRAAGADFEMDYGHGRIERLSFGLSATVNGNNEVTFALLTRAGLQSGMSLTVSRRFLRGQDAEAFIRLRKSGREQGVEGGVKVLF